MIPLSLPDINHIIKMDRILFYYHLYETQW